MGKVKRASIAEEYTRVKNANPDANIFSLTLEALNIWDWLKAKTEDNIKSAYPPPLRIYMEQDEDVPEIAHDDKGNRKFTMAMIHTEWVHMNQHQYKDQTIPITTLPENYELRIFVPNLIASITAAWGTTPPFMVVKGIIDKMFFHEYTHYCNMVNRIQRIYTSDPWEETMIDVMHRLDHHAELEFEDESETEDSAIALFGRYYLEDYVDTRLDVKPFGPMANFLRKKRPELKEIIDLMRVFRLNHTLDFNKNLSKDEYNEGVDKLIKIELSYMDDPKRDRHPFIFIY